MKDEASICASIGKGKWKQDKTYKKGKQKKKMDYTSFEKLAGEILFKEEMRRRDWAFLKLEIQLS